MSLQLFFQLDENNISIDQSEDSVLDISLYKPLKVFNKITNSKFHITVSSGVPQASGDWRCQTSDI